MLEPLGIFAEPPGGEPADAKNGWRKEAPESAKMDRP